jgi:hypothetical protein
MIDEALRISGFLVKPDGSKRWWAKFFAESFQRHAILQRHARESTDAVHQATNRRTFFGHRDEKFAWLSIFEQATVR